jgi:hypothetical protein
LASIFRTWLAAWNEVPIKEILLRPDGPHVYLHGHLHHTHGQSMAMSGGQALTFFGAGAGYQSEKGYRNSFSIYDVDTLAGTIECHEFEYLSAKNDWIEKNGNRPFKSVLPKANSISGLESEAFAALMRSVIENHEKLFRTVQTKIAPLVGMAIGDESIRRDVHQSQFSEKNVALLGIDVARFKRESEQAAAKALIEGRPVDALRHLGMKDDPKDEDIKGKEADFRWLYVVALVLSAESKYLRFAKRIVGALTKQAQSELNEPILLVNFGVGFWLVGDLDFAIAATEQAIDLLKKKNGAERLAKEEFLRWQIRAYGNMAYYLAEAQVSRRMSDALEYCEQAMKLAIEYQKEPGVSDGAALYTDQLDNRGFVKITFGATAVAIGDGLKDCEDARRMGANVRMFKSHVDRAVARLTALP